ncbi:hypothetical protein K501DRAFT_330218 [Backusella circina FSU 941]|nr:hypothetical protein K501DRAFT_330218 [Backusella circina FSU 941]
MTPTRRTRKTAKAATPTQIVESQSSDDDSSDSGSVTRCVCGESHNVGLMVQCDKCEVWQHCECVGLEEEQIPDHYYCDYCQPNQPQTAATRPKRLYDAASNVEEEEGSDNLTWSNTVPGSNSDVDAERQSKRRKKSPSATNEINSSENSSLTDFSSSSISTASTSMTNTSEKVSPVTERRSRRTKLPAEEEIEEAPKKKNCVSCKRTNCSCHSENNKKAPKSHQQSNLHSHSHHSNSPKTNSKSNNNSSNNTNSNPTLHIMTEDAFYWDQQGRPTRESSPPAKVRYPHDKMSFGDMTKRAKQITETLSKMQNDLLKEPDTPPLSDVQVTLDDVMNDRRKYAHSSTTSCSLSSASTVPIMDECSLLKNFEVMEPASSLHRHDETSLEILDRLNRDLIKFQRKFGSIQETTPTSIATSKMQRLASKR